MNLSFAGCGFLGIYHVGVAVCFKKYAPHLLLDKIGGASAGALAACCLLCDLPLGEMTSDFFRVVNEARRYSLGPFSPSFNIQTCLYEGLEKHLPEDAHKRVSGRLHISLTRVYDGKNVIVSQFDSRKEVLQAMLCACFIPGFSGILPPRFRGVRYMDGAFSDNLPILDENTVTVSPFCGESDICPRDQSSQLFHVNWANTSIELSRQNITRFIRILFPPRPEFLSNLCQQGFDDALKFLHRNNLISCRRCIAVQSTIVVSSADSITNENDERIKITEKESDEEESSAEDYDPECRECKKHRKDALIGNMPETVLDVFQSYIDSANKGLINWLFKYRGIKLLSLPATVPADILLATINKLSSLVPHIIRQLKKIIKFFIEQANDVVIIKLLNKININLDLQSFGCIADLLQPEVHNNRHASRRVSILIDESGSKLKENFGEYDTFDNILKVTTHHDAVYAYYYTDDDTNKVKITEIFDMTENESLPPKLNLIEPNPKLELDEWNGIESDLLIGTTLNNNNYIDALFESDSNDNNYPNDLQKYINVERMEQEELESEMEGDYSDPEVDRYVSEHTKVNNYTSEYIAEVGQQEQINPSQPIDIENNKNIL